MGSFNPKKIKFGLSLSPIGGRPLFKFSPKIKSIKDVANTDFSDRPTFTFNQGPYSSCVYNACGMCATDVDFVKNGTPYVMPARFAPYFQYRKSIGRVEEDTGSSGYDACGIYRKFGLGPESLDPYTDDRFKLPPTAEYLEAAKKNELLGFERIDTSNNSIICDLLRCALFDHGTMLPFGAMLPKIFMGPEVAQSGEFMKCSDLQMLRRAGGHEMTLVGSIRPMAGESFEPYFIILNSWGEDWGCKGKNGLRGFCKVSEKIMARWILEANVITQMEA